ncbi:vesicular acetylcholine transporter [Anastrepha ludens]|uniref:vesicular acetylcholine transporter n=1 Tax=Anastrepha ludens TaxID=28586 RepID=UPI0023AFA9D8|nr:vesicular acetylcholine transporter [Anastrepha ludens]
MAGSFQIPLLNLELREVKEIVWEKIQEPVNQRRLILVIVSIALLLDNMLYMVIVPIIPDYLREIGSFEDDTPMPPLLRDNRTGEIIPVHHDHHGQDSATGILFASKAIVQLMVNPFSGGLIDRIGYDLPMMIGLTIMFFSTAMFACGRSYSLLFFARSLQGAGSAFADTSGLAMIADRFTEENERSQALGIALAFISFGCLVAPPFGGALYQFAGKEVPFLILALMCLLDGLMLLLVMKPVKEQIRQSKEVQQQSIPIWRLLMDPYIAVCAGALTMANVALAFLEPIISLWMEDNLTTENWKIGMVWLPAFFPHLLGVIITVKMAKKYPHHQWLMAAVGLALEGFSCFIIPFSSSYTMLMIPICVICFGIALIDTALLPTLGYLVDVRHVSVYGSIYAIADISYSIAYAVGPIIAGGVVEAIGFTALNFIIAFSNLLYVPVLRKLRNIYDFKPFENEANILMQDPPNKEYQTYVMHDQKPIDGDFKNHLEYGQQYQQEQESNVDDTNYEYQQQGEYQQTGGGGGGGFQQNQGYQQQYQPGYQEQGGNYQQESRHLPQQRVANPFQHQQQQQQQHQQQMNDGVGASRGPAGPANPFRQGF